MSPLDRARRRLRNVLDREGVEREMDEEMRFHLEMEVEERVRGGMAPEEARRTALRDFGAAERFQDEGREARGIGWMENLSQDVRFTLRGLRRTPGFAAIAVLTLGLGIGASTAIFSVVNGVLLRSLPFPEPDRLVAVGQVNGESGPGNFSHPNFVDVRERARSFSALAAYQNYPMPVGVGEEAARVGVATVSEDFFRALGVRPLRGRAFTAEEWSVGAPVAMVGEAYWRDRLGAPLDLAAATVRVGETVRSVVGILPESGGYPAGAELWVPQTPQTNATRTGHNWRALGRLAPGATPEAATAELNAIARELKAIHGDKTWMVGGEAKPLREHLVGHVRPALLVLLGASGLLLLIACANVVNLLLTRMAGRRRELAVRLALGAGRVRLVRQFVSESLVLTGLGAVLGALLAWGGVRALLALEPGRLPRAGEAQVDGAALLFALAVSLATAVGMGVVVALRAGDGDLREALAEGARGQSTGAASQRTRTALAIGQVALTLVLLVGAGLLARSFFQLLAVDPGYRTSGAVTLDLLFPWVEEEAERARLVRLHDELIARMERIPGVAAVGSVDVLPLSGTGGSDGTFLKVTGDETIESFADFDALMKEPGRAGDANYRIASEGYFRAMGIPLVRGRLFEPRDDPAAPPAAVISQSLAEAAWPGEDPLGRLVQYGGMDGDLRPFVVVGIVGDVRERGLDAEPGPIFYANARQRPSSIGGPITLVLQGGADDAATITAARGVLRELAPEIPVRFRTLDEVFSASLTDRRFSLILLGAFALIALVLAVTGIYGIISHLVAQRTREIGIRLALGARVGTVLGMVVRSGVLLALAGVALGVVAALLSTRLLAGMLYGVDTLDPLTFAAVPLLLLAVAALASYLPARRTTRVDPMIAMRAE